MSVSDMDLALGLKGSQFIKRLDEIFNGVRPVEHYANLCHSVVYGVFEYRKVIDTASRKYYSTTWVRINEDEYISSRNVCFTKENPFYCLIYNFSRAIGLKRLSIERIKAIAHALSAHDFYKVMKNNPRIRAAFKEFMNRAHPNEDYWLDVNKKEYSEIVEVLFYGAVAAMLWRHVCHEVDRVTKDDNKDIDHLRSFVFSIGEHLDALVSKMRLMSSDEDINKANSFYLDKFNEYKSYIDRRRDNYISLGHDPRKGNFAKDKGYDVIRFMQSDIIFCLRDRIEFKASKRGPIASIIIAGPEEEFSGNTYLVDEAVATRSLRSGLGVAKCITDFFKGSYVKVEDIETYVLPHVAKKVSAMGFHDYANSFDGVMTYLTLLTRGEFYETWRNELNITIFRPDRRLSKDAYWHLPSLRRHKALEDSTLGIVSG